MGYKRKKKEKRRKKTDKISKINYQKSFISFLYLFREKTSKKSKRIL